MSEPSIEARLLAEVKRQLGLYQEPKLTNTFVGDFGCDSLDMVELAMALEDEFCIVIDDDEGMKCATVSDVLALVNKSNPS